MRIAQDGEGRLLQAALGHAARGWRVVPEYGLRDGACTCRSGSSCSSPGKHPRLSKWQLKATTDPETIKEWWERWPDANVGVVTGPESGLLVIDVDTETRADADGNIQQTDGEDTLRVLEAKHGALPATVEVTTGSGGRHIYFAWPEGIEAGDRIRFAPALDARAGGRDGHGGNLVAPPARHVSGGTYEFEASCHPDDVPLALPPAWLIDLLVRPKRPPPPDVSRRMAAETTELGRLVLDVAREYLSTALWHGRDATGLARWHGNQSLFETSAFVGGYVAGGHITGDGGLEALIDAADRHRPEPRPVEKDHATIRNGLRRGQEHPSGVDTLWPRWAWEIGGEHLKAMRRPEPPPPTDEDAPEWIGNEDPMRAETPPSAHDVDAQDHESPPPLDPDDPGPQAEVEPEAGPRPDTYDFCPTEIDRSREYVEQQGDDLRYCYARKKHGWLAWDGRRWSWDAQAEVARRAENTAKLHLAKESQYATSEPKRVKAAADACSVPKRRSMVEGAQHHLAVTIDELDSDPWLLNCENVTINLRTGEARAHRRGDLITKIAPVLYEPNARAPRWERFLAEVLVTETGELDSELAAFVQRAVGYSLTGETREQVLLLLVGPRGSNGKSVLLETLGELLGDYGCTLAFSTLLEDRHGRNKGPELLPLLGSRLAVASEPNAGQRLDESAVKSLTGEDRIAVNPKYEAVFEFDNRAKLWLACNMPPRLSSGGDSMMRRIRVVPFRRHFFNPRVKGREPSGPLEGVRDDRLADDLARELPGILCWAIEGCLEWQRRGLASPRSVTLAGDEYQGDNDPIAGWLAAHVCTSPGTKTKMIEAHRSYSAWAEGQGFKPVGSRNLGGLLKGHGYTLRRVGGYSQVLDVLVTMPATAAEEDAEEVGHAVECSSPKTFPIHA